MNQIPHWANEQIKKVQHGMYRELILSGQDKKEKLKIVPPGLANLTWLQKLDLSHNNIASIPDDLAKLQNLWWLDLSNNQIGLLPENFTELTKLERLNLGNNSLQMLPDTINKLHRLEVLNLSNNDLTVIPNTIADLHKLVDFFLKNNPVHTPSPEILGLSKPFGKVNIRSTFSYFRKIQTEGSDVVFEAKLIILGRGRVGKTSLATRLMNQDAPLPETSTDGVDIYNWEIPLPDRLIKAQNAKNTQYKSFHVNIWDFGGQEVYHATHQFFLTKRSLYILVADSAAQHTDFDYWLHVAEKLGGNSPVIIVANEKQERNWDYDEKRLQRRFTNIVSNRRVNLRTNRGLKALSDEIRYRITTLPHVGGEIPMSWFKVRQYLESINKPYISQEEYVKICQLWERYELGTLFASKCIGQSGDQPAPTAVIGI